MNNDIYSFYKLISEYKIEIPVIQRDYAQGRQNSKAKDVRESIVKSIVEAVSDETKSLFFDFVYGRVAGDVFIPFDRQQRLTTLFLFHRYIFEKCRHESDCSHKEACQCVTLLSRFTYKTRQSSREFCEQLVNQKILPTEGKISAFIKDQPWFFSDWENDPTVVGMLAVLDEIEQQCMELDYKAVAQKLTSGCVCPIKFHFVDMGKHKMSDTTYIKMNARGKSLTSFENFKASLEEYLKQKEKELYYRFTGMSKDDEKSYNLKSIDGYWLDLFYGETKPIVPDLLMLSFFKRHFLNAYVVRNFNEKNRESKVVEEQKKVVEELERQLSADDFVSFETFKEVLTGNEKTVLMPLFALLDAISVSYDDIMRNALPVWYRNDYVNKSDFDRLSQKDKSAKTFWNPLKGSWRNKGQRSENNESEGTQLYQSRVAFYAVVKYFEVVRNQFNAESFARWMRVIWNYIGNVTFDNFQDYAKDLKLVDTLSQRLKPGDFYDWLGRQDKTTVVSRRERMDEEFKKARLVSMSRDKWEKRILTLEEHKYFTGEIKFMFDFLGDEPDAAKFDLYSKVMCELFTAGGLNKQYDTEGAFLFRRVLMLFSVDSSSSFGYYKGRNLSFWKDKDRDIGWKRFISDEKKNKCLNQLIDTLCGQENYKVKLQEIVNGNRVTDWREAFIRNEKLWSYMGESKFIRKVSDDKIYLLKKTQMNGAHAELRTYDLYTNGDIQGCKNWEVKYYSPSEGGEKPCVFLEKRMNGNTFVMDIHWDTGKYCLELYLREERNFSSVLTPIVEDKFPYDSNILNLLRTNPQRYRTQPMMKEDLIILAKLVMGAI